MSIFKRYGLLIRLILGIGGGILIGMTGIEVLIKIFVTFTSLFGSVLSFTVPLIIFAFITNGIAELGSGSSKLLLLTVIISYCSTVLMGGTAAIIDMSIFPSILSGQTLTDIVTSREKIEPFLKIEIPPIMPVMTALIFSFILGIGLSHKKDSPLRKGFNDFHDIIATFVSKGLIPLLPIYIIGVFANITYTGQAGTILSSFAKVFAIVLPLQWGAIFIQFSIASAITKKNFFQLIKTMMPAYFTALGTQSSAASIPVTTQCMKDNGVTNKVAEFVASLCSNIHMSGSVISITSTAIAVMILYNFEYSIITMIPFILMLAVIIVAAPGIPSGVIFAALGILQSMMGFDESMLALMISLHVAQDSFGTACNITGDGAIALVVDEISYKTTNQKS